MRWHTKPFLQLMVMFGVMGAVVASQQAFTIYSARGQATPALPIAQLQEEGLVQVQAGGCIEGQDAPLGDTYGLTQAEKDNMLNRWPISGNPNFETYFGYDIFGSKNSKQYTKMPLSGAELDDATTIKNIDGRKDTKAENLLGSMFGYTPIKLQGAYKMKYPGGMGEPPDYIHGNYPGITVPAAVGTQVKAPNLPQYPIGGGFGAMVVYADSSKITLHIGRHEYVSGAFDNSSTCGGGGCSGGYWIYIENICVATRILDSYRTAYNQYQKDAPADKNPIKLPMVRPGQVVGVANNDRGVNIVVVDNGPIIAANDTHFWKAPVGGAAPPAGGQPPTATLPPQGGGGGQCFVPSIDFDITLLPTGVHKFTPTLKLFSPPGGKDGLVQVQMMTSSPPSSTRQTNWNKATNNPFSTLLSNFYFYESTRNFPNSLNLLELTDSYRIKIDNCAPMPNEITISCKMGLREGTPFVESTSGHQCNCLPANMCVTPTQPPAQQTPTPPAGATTTTPPPAGTTPTTTPAEPLPTLTVQGDQLIFRFENCNSNQLCTHLLRLMSSTETRLASIKEGSSELFRLKLGITMIHTPDNPVPGGARIAMKKYDGNFPNMATVGSLRILLPDPDNVTGPLSTYVLK
ncbi:MAG TPA: hypothetical protein PKG71_03735 [Candidatus Woesebacteria bacterium]|nr:hypothetical protein [Candidatus Woesebacteria bacterium]